MIYPWQEQQWQQLKAVAAGGRLPHALLLTGAEGMGLTTFAEQLVDELMCGQLADDAGKGRIRALLGAGTHPDVLTVQPEQPGKQIKVDIIRQLIDFIHLSSQSGTYKIAIVTPAEAMNRNAANALLKTLEEPPPNSLLVLISRQPARLPVTIRSRCQRLNFPPVETAVATAWLADQALGEVQRPQLAILLELAQGAPLRALALHEAGSLGQFRTIMDDLAEVQQARAMAVSIAEKWLAYDSAQLFYWLLTLFSRMVRLKCVAFSKSADKSPINKDLHRLSDGLDLPRLIACYDQLLAGYHAATGPYNLNKQGQLEGFIVYWQSQFSQ